MLASDARLHVIPVLEALYAQVDSTKDVVSEFVGQARERARLTSQAISRRSSAMQMHERVHAQVQVMNRKFKYARTIYHPRYIVMRFLAFFSPQMLHEPC